MTNAIPQATENERRALTTACRRLVDGGLVSGTNGNVSLRLRRGDDHFVLITAHGANLETLADSDLSLIDMNGEPLDEELPPSSESALHLGIYASRPDVSCVAHTHPIFATVAAVAGEPIPPIVDEMVIRLGGPVAVADYGFPGSEELAANVVAALADRNAALLRNHGLVTLGGSADDAIENAVLVERVAQVFLYTSLLGKANVLPPEVVQLERQLYLMKRSTEQKEEG